MLDEDKNHKNRYASRYDVHNDYDFGYGRKVSYLVTFDFSSRHEMIEPQWMEHNGKRIFEVTI